MATVKAAGAGGDLHDPDAYDVELEAEAFKSLAMRVFDVFDGDGDGFLNQRELGMALRKLDQNISEADLTAVLGQVPSPSALSSSSSFATSGVSAEHFGRLIEHIRGRGHGATAEISEATVEEALRAFDFARSGTINIDFLLAVLEQTNGPDKLTAQESAELLQLVEGDPGAVPTRELLNIFFPVTDAELQEVDERTRNKQKQKSTRFIFKEIYDTEKNYVESLDYCVNAYLRPMQAYVAQQQAQMQAQAAMHRAGARATVAAAVAAATGSGQTKPIVSAGDIKTLFSNWERLLAVNKDLLRQMESLGPLNVWSWSKGLIPILLDFIPKLKVYSQYCSNYDESSELLARLKLNSDWSDYARRWVDSYGEGDAKFRNLGLNSYLIMPVQRLCKYPLFLRDLVKNNWYSPSHPYSYGLEEVEHGFKRAAKEVDNKTKEARNAIEAIRVFAMLERGGRYLPPDLRAAHRHYVHRSSVTTELLRFGSLPQFAPSDATGNFLNDQAGGEFAIVPGTGPRANKTVGNAVECTLVLFSDMIYMDIAYSYRGDRKDQFRTKLGNVAIVTAADHGDDGAPGSSAGSDGAVAAAGSESGPGAGGGAGAEDGGGAAGSNGGDTDELLLQSGSAVTDYPLVFVFGMHSGQRTLKVPMKVYFKTAVAKSEFMHEFSILQTVPLNHRELPVIAVQGRPSFKLQPNLVTRKPLFLDDKLSTVSDMPSFLFNLPYFTGPKQPRLATSGVGSGGSGGGGGGGGGGSGMAAPFRQPSFLPADTEQAALSGGDGDSVLQFRINKPAKIFVLWCEENELEKWLNSGFVLRSESVSLDWSLDYHFEIYESKEVHPAGSLISLPALSFSNDQFYNFVVAVQFV